jgi:hypothetical protein
MKVAVHQPHYFPYPGFFHKLSLADAFVIMDDVQYDRGFVNRNRILDVHGPVWLTVPINKSQKFMTIAEVEVNNAIPWREDHLKKLQVSYANSKYFHLYRDDLDRFYSRDWTTVFELDLAALKLTMGWLGMDLPIILESELGVSSTGTQRLVDVCAATGADTYISGRGGKDYMDESLFGKNGITLEYQAYSPAEYPQRMSDSFVPDLSIIDTLANLGPSTMGFITEPPQVLTAH